MAEEQEPDTLKLSEARDLTGISVQTLQLLVTDKLLPGAVRARAGHVRLRADLLPEWDDVRELLVQRRAALIDRARRELQRVRSEVEAVDNDLVMARDEPGLDLGHDLVTFRPVSTRPESSVSSAMFRLQSTIFDIERYHDALRELEVVGPRHVD